MAEIFWLNVKGYKIIVNATAHIKNLYTNLGLRLLLSVRVKRQLANIVINSGFIVVIRIDLGLVQ